MRLARLNRRLIISLGALAALAGMAHAQNYPARPVTMVIPQTVGGTNDIVGRLIAQKLGEALGGSVMAEDRPGAGDNIGTAYVAKAPRDGHTLMLTVSSAQLASLLNEDLARWSKIVRESGTTIN